MVRGPLKKANDPGQITLDWWKLYLDSCTTNHTAFLKSYLTDIHKTKTTFQTICYAGVTTSNIKGLLLGIFDMWINTNEIANLLSVPKLEDDGFCVTYDTQGKWTLHTPKR